MHSAQEGVRVRGTSVCRSQCAGLSVHTPDASIPHLDPSVYRSFQVSRSKCISTVALAKYSGQSVKIWALVTVRGTNWKHGIQNDLHNAWGFRSLIDSQWEYKHWHISTFQCAFPLLFCHKSHGDNNSGQFYPVTFYHCFGDFVRHISQAIWLSHREVALGWQAASLSRPLVWKHIW